MYGEKVEQVEELQLDLQDVKAMYKQQVCKFVTFFKYWYHFFSTQIEQLLQRTT